MPRNIRQQKLRGDPRFRIMVAPDDEGFDPRRIQRFRQRVEPIAGNRRIGDNKDLVSPDQRLDLTARILDQPGTDADIVAAFSKAHGNRLDRRHTLSCFKILGSVRRLIQPARLCVHPRNNS